MKEHSLVAGGRKWFGTDFVELQKEALDAVQGLVADYAPCVLSGCVVVVDAGDQMTVTAGLALMKDASGAARIVRVPASGPIHIDLHPRFLTLVSTPASRLYDDTVSREVSREWKGQWAATRQTPGDIQFVKYVNGYGELAPVPRLLDKFGAAAASAAIGAQITLSASHSVGASAMSVTAQANLLTRMVHVRGTLVAANAQAISNVMNLGFGMSLPAEWTPVGDCYFPIMRRVHNVTPAQALELSQPIMGGYRSGSFCASPTKPADSSITSYTGYFNVSWPMP